MSFNKLTLIREFGLGVGMTLFLCLAPQDSAFWIGAVFVGMFTIYETFPDFHWIPAWTLYKVVAGDEEMLQGALRIAVQFGAALLGGIVGYQLLNVDMAVHYPMYTHSDDWRSLVWAALVWAGWLALTNHAGGQKDSFRRNLGLTATFVSANFILQGIAEDSILNSAVNFGRLVGAKIYFDGQDAPAAEPNFDQLWLVLLGPVLGAVGAWVALQLDGKIAIWAAEPAEKEETQAVYGSTGDNANQDEAAAKKEEA